MKYILRRDILDDRCMHVLFLPKREIIMYHIYMALYLTNDLSNKNLRLPMIYIKGRISKNHQKKCVRLSTLFEMAKTAKKFLHHTLMYKISHIHILPS